MFKAREDVYSEEDELMVDDKGVDRIDVLVVKDSRLADDPYRVLEETAEVLLLVLVNDGGC